MPYNPQICNQSKTIQVKYIKMFLEDYAAGNVTKKFAKYTVSDFLGGIPHAKDDNSGLELISEGTREYLKTIPSKLLAKVLTADGKVLQKYGIGFKVVYEHAVPTKVWVSWLMGKAEEKTLTEADITYAVENIKLAVVTKEEDKLLNAAKLQSKMPKGWKMGDDPLARYNAVGIKLAKVA